MDCRKKAKDRICQESTEEAVFVIVWMVFLKKSSNSASNRVVVDVFKILFRVVDPNRKALLILINVPLLTPRQRLLFFLNGSITYSALRLTAGLITSWPSLYC